MMSSLILNLIVAVNCTCGEPWFEDCMGMQYEVCEMKAWIKFNTCLIKDSKDTSCVLIRDTDVELCKKEYLSTVFACFDYYKKHHGGVNERKNKESP